MTKVNCVSCTPTVNLLLPHSVYHGSWLNPVGENPQHCQTNEIKYSFIVQYLNLSFLVVSVKWITLAYLDKIKEKLT